MTILSPVISLFVTGCLFAATATPPSIGTIKSPGAFRVDGATIRGNSTVFDGNVIETDATRSVIELTGAQITLSRQSRVKLFSDRIVLENGGGLVRNASGHLIEAATLRIAAASNGSVLQIDVAGPTHIAVSARGGGAEIRNASGVLVASLQPGTALAFNPQAAAAAAASVTGVLRMNGTAFFLTDTTGNITFELRGVDLAKYIDKSVRVTGSIRGNAKPATGASQVIEVTSIDVSSKEKKAAVPISGASGAAGTAAASSSAGAAGAAAGGLSSTAVVAIIGGVGVAAGVAGMAVTGSFSGDSPISRP